MAALPLLALCVAWSVPNPAQASDCTIYERYLHWVGGLETSYTAIATAVGGNHAYVVDLQDGFLVIDISNPSSPQIVGGLLGQWMEWFQLAASETRVYVADRRSGLKIVDVEDPTDPRIVGSVATPGGAWSVAVAGAFAYVGDLENGFHVVDVADADDARIVGSLPLPNGAAAVAVAGSNAYVAGGEAGFLVVDVSNPQSPELVGNADTPGASYGVAVSGAYAFVTDFEGYVGRLLVIQVSDPRNPRIVGSVDVHYEIYGMAVSGSHAFLACGWDGLFAVDVSDPANPEVVNSMDWSGFADYHAYAVTAAPSLAIPGSCIYVAGAYWVQGFPNGCLQIFDVASAQYAPSFGIVDTPSSAGDVAVAGAYAYVADGSSGLQVADIGDPHVPAIIGAVDTPGYARSVAVAGSYAYVADSDSGLVVIDVGTPESPRIIGGVLTPSPPWRLAQRGRYVYVACGAAGLVVIDVDDPENPWIAGSLDTPGFAGDVDVSGAYAYVVDSGEQLDVIDISNPQDPRMLAVVELPDHAHGITVLDGHAYVTIDGGLVVVDISGPPIFGIVGRASLPRGVGRPVASRSHLYVANGMGGAHILSVRDPLRPRNVGSMDVRWSVRGVAVSGAYVYLAEGESGLRVVPSECEPAPTGALRDRAAAASPAARLFPNPAAAGATIRLEMPAFGAVRATIYDPSGRRVRALHDGDLPAGSHMLLWDQRDDDGRPVAAGVYFVRLSSLAGARAERLVVVR